MVSGGDNYEYRFGPNNDWSVVVANTRTLRARKHFGSYTTCMSARGTIYNWGPMTDDELDYFGALKTRILAETKPETVAILMEYYRQTEGTVQD